MPESTTIEITVGKTGEDYQVGHFINSLHELVCHYENFGMDIEHIQKALRLYAETRE